MATCFVIQPFDAGKFDQRFQDVYKPAIEEAGLEAYRVDQDPTVEVPIEAIEKGIREASICLADITTDNPNVWYELGFASAAGRPVVMVCSDERKGKKYPFDIQHRNIIPYRRDSSSDFDRLVSDITRRLKALKGQQAALPQIGETDEIALSGGLTELELLVLVAVVGAVAVPDGAASLYSIKVRAGRLGLTDEGFIIGMRRLGAKGKGFICISAETNYHGDPIEVVGITEEGWAWIEANESLFVILRSEKRMPDSDDIPF